VLAMRRANLSRGKDMRLAGCALACFCALFLSEAIAAEGDPSWSSSAVQNVSYAVSHICAPYVLDHVDIAALPLNQSLVREDGWRDPSSGKAMFRVGFAGFVHVLPTENASGRGCEMTAARADPNQLRRAILDAIAQRSEGFGPTKSRYYPGRWAA